MTTDEHPEGGVVINIVGCARCGGQHNDAVFLPLARPMLVEGVTLSHWTPCPSTHEPILAALQVPKESKMAPPRDPRKRST